MQNAFECPVFRPDSAYLVKSSLGNRLLDTWPHVQIFITMHPVFFLQALYAEEGGNLPGSF